LLVASREPDLSVTALYTAGVWAWSRQPGAELFAHQDARRVFRATNFALACARPYRTKPPSLRHSLVQRHVVIDRVVRNARPARVLELASGLAARGVRLSADPHVQVVEVDRPQVIAKKRALAARSDAGRAALARPNWKLEGGDLAVLDLASVVPDGAGPLAVVAEGLLMYLDAAAQAALCARVRRLYDDAGGVFVFDFVPWTEQTGAGASGRMLGWLMKRFTKGGAFARDNRTRAEFVNAVANAGFDVECIDPRAAPSAWNVPHRDVRTQQLVFVARPR
jgi:O-methyltransferase involved in polyketide biosynthesis